jgi:hypothetical protein
MTPDERAPTFSSLLDEWLSRGLMLSLVRGSVARRDPDVVKLVREALRSA